MNMDKKVYARYFIVRGNHALWKGDPAESGAHFRQVVITSDEWNSTQGIFQVYALAGTGKGIVDAKLSVSPEPTVLFDGDFQGLDAAGEKFEQIVKEAQEQGFKSISLFDVMEFRSKLERAKGGR
jgi:hypothetical protein